MGRTTLFSDTTEAVVAAMQATGVGRLVAVTGIGAGDTKGHGGWFYNYVIYPLFTRHRYADKDRQEAMIACTDLDWTIVRPAPFAAQASGAPLQVHTDIPAGLQLSAITRAEVATFILDCLEGNAYVRQKPFIGHLAARQPAVSSPSGPVLPATAPPVLPHHAARSEGHHTGTSTGG